MRTSNPTNEQPVQLLINVSNLGIDGTASGGDTDTYTEAGASYGPEHVAEGYTIWNITDTESATIDAPDVDGNNGGAQGANIESDALTGAAAWANTETAGIPECRRFVIDMAGCRFLTLQTYLHAADTHNSCYLKIYATISELANAEDDTHWIDISEDVFGVGVTQLIADGIGDGAEAWDTGLYIIDTDTPVSKYMIKIVAEFDAVAGQDNDFKVWIKKSN